jgi:predicted ATPase with chaperone activity
MTIDEALDVTRIYSVADQLPANTPLIQNRPFRAHLKACTCSMGPVTKYQKRISGPLPHRIDLKHSGPIEVLRVEYDKLSDDRCFIALVG